MLVSLASILRPLAKLMLLSGLGFSEFSAVAKSVFVQVASEQYGLRGRPTNISRISAMTGISRKEITKIRAEGPVDSRWIPDLESNPANTVMHYWHYDPDFAESAGQARPLRLDGPGSFAELVARYAGDIPPGAIRAELRRMEIIEETEGFVFARQRFFSSAHFDTDLVRRIAFSLANLGETVAHNVKLYHLSDVSKEVSETLGRLERAAWTEHLRAEDVQRFKRWIRQKAIKFVEDANHWLGEHELPKSEWKRTPPRSVGIGVYYFEEAEELDRKN